MNKNIKRTIALALAVGSLSAVAPATNYNLLTTKAYASNDDADNLDSVDLEDEDGSSLDLYTDDDYEEEVDDDLDEGDTYYTETTTSEVKIDNVSGPNDDNVRIFVGTDEYEVGDSISVDEGITTLKIRVYEDDYDEEEDYDSDDYNEYKIKVEYTGDDENDDEDNEEDTLDSLELLDENGDNIDFYSDSNYDEEVDTDEVDEGNTYYAETSSNEVSIETSGPSDEYVRIFKSTSDSAKGIEIGDDISVAEDKTLTVRIYSEEPDDDIEYEDDSDVIGEYEIKLEYIGNDSASSIETATDTSSTNGTSSTTNTTLTPETMTTVSPATEDSNVKYEQWVQVNGGWRYIDSLGKTIKNTWFFDRNYSKWYYLGVDGTMAANLWIPSGGKYYYVGYNGAMVTNTIISGYKIGADGAWIK